MKVLELKKFGNILNSRSFGREAVLRVRQIINGEKDTLEDLVLDFHDVEIVTPSFADEFIKGLKEQYPYKQIKIQGTENNQVLKDVLRLITR
ncbi:MAG: STAS-like domain-containing protein [bacterium]|nr:STAS-like domain-containing protein [bacterium]